MGLIRVCCWRVGGLVRASRPACSDAEPALVGVDAVGRFLQGRHGAGHGPVVPGRLPLPRPRGLVPAHGTSQHEKSSTRTNYDENVNHTPTRKTGVSPTLDLRHTFLYLTPFPRRLPMLGRDERHGMRMFGGSARKYAQM